ncbi:MAG: hypothetical protein HQL37_14765 [Alphaproteobacteria bacterium]|nr:hypothetical protein [Alphaproteobacteria bacterium]
MEQHSVLAVAIANLAKSHEFLLKLIDVCANLPGAASNAGDKEVLTALATLARMTESVIHAADLARRGGGEFVASFPGQNDVVRLRIVMDMCLQQADHYRQRIQRLENEAATLRDAIQSVEADLLAARTALSPKR